MEVNMLEKGDLLTLSNGREYIVISQIQIKGKNYVYLVTKDGVSGVAVCLLENDTLTMVNDGELLQSLLEKFKEQGELENE